MKLQTWLGCIVETGNTFSFTVIPNVPVGVKVVEPPVKVAVCP
jgi:hypothetical protein